MGSVPAVEGVRDVGGDQQRVVARSMNPGLYDMYRALRATCLSDPELDIGKDFLIQ